MSLKPTALIILDGLGLDPDGRIEGDAFKLAKTPLLDSLLEEWPNSRLHASHSHVGLPDGQMGNSEVGHLNIGAGRIVYQDLVKVSKALENGEFQNNQPYRSLLDGINNLHLMGLVSDGGVHSHLEHIIGIIELTRNLKPELPIYIHCLLDGRDTPPDSAAGFIQTLQAAITKIGGEAPIQIRSLIGRIYAMDRDTNWERTHKAYDLLVNGVGEAATDPVAALKASYENKVTDEFVEPIVVGDGGNIKDGDGIFFFNFRADRARQITRAFTESDEVWQQNFDRGNKLDVKFLCLTEYHEDFGLPVAFTKETPGNTIGEVIAGQKKKQLRIAETEKYAHVTFFFNGGSDEPLSGEERILVPSPKVKTYDMQPEMSAGPVTEELIAAIDKDEYEFIVLNYANPDMVGHTGILEAAIKALEAVDTSLGKLLDKIKSKGGQAYITADHGNCEQMYEKGTYNPHTAHTTNQVFFVAFGAGNENVKLNDGKLADIAPTILTAMGLPIPAEMTGNVLFADNLGKLTG